MRSRRRRSGSNDVGSCWVASLPWAPHSRRAPRASSSRGGSPPMSLALPSRSRRRWMLRRRPRQAPSWVFPGSVRSSRRTTSSTGSTPPCSCPRFDAEDWSLRIHGMVDREIDAGLRAAHRAAELIERDITLTCVSNEVGGPYIGNARWVGVPAEALAGGGRGRSRRRPAGLPLGRRVDDRHPDRGRDGRARRDARRRA